MFLDPVGVALGAGNARAVSFVVRLPRTECKSDGIWGSNDLYGYGLQRMTLVFHGSIARAPSSILVAPATVTIVPSSSTVLEA